MGQISLALPTVGQLNQTEDPKIPSAFTTIQTVINGNLDATNLTTAVVQSAGVNSSGQVVKGATSFGGSESRTNAAYGTMPTPDQVSGLVLPSPGLIQVWFQATWQESVAGAAFGAIFIGSNQLKIAQTTTPVVQETAVADNGTINTPRPIFTNTAGLSSGPTSSSVYTGDVTTGQLVGGSGGGLTSIFAAAGTYTVSIQFKASSGNVVVAGRKLWVQALSFA